MVKKLSVVLFFFFLTSVACFTDDYSQKNLSLNQKNLAIEIHHCPTCGFRARADSLAEELFTEFSVEAKLVTGEIGSFDVYVNDELIFSKKEAGRFPDSGEIVQKIKEYMKNNE
jgi:selenoprotein W-related protein